MTVWRGTSSLDFHHGDAAKVEAAFASAAHVTRLEIVNNRIVVSSMEPRAAVADYDSEADRYVMHIVSQGVFGMRAGLAQAMNVAPEKVRVLTGHVGGSFGMKASVYPEYVALLHAAKALRRPVKWTDSRSESFVSDHQGRDHVIDAALGARCGRALPCAPTVRDRQYRRVSVAVVALYRDRQHHAQRDQRLSYAAQIEMSSICCFTNTVPIAAYRGAGRPEGNYVMERLVEAAARETGRDPVALRKLNHIRPDELPFTTSVGTVYDSGDFSGLLDHALAAADWDGYARAQRADSERRGLLRGRGVGQYLEITAPATDEMGGIRFEENGDVTIVTGTLDYGQGHATPFAQVLVAQLGVPYDRVRLRQNDSDELVAGGGTGGSKSLMASGTAIVEASAKVIEAGRAAAAHVLEAAPADIEFARGRFVIAGTDRGIELIELAHELRERRDLPPDCPATLDITHVHKMSASTYPNGCHVAEVEVDPQTGNVQVVRYTMANDFGTVVNPMIVAGQAQGGVLQGIGQALMERTAVDASGPSSDRLLPGLLRCRARRTRRPFTIEDHPTIATTNPLGVKGCGEAGCAGSLPAVMNALVDALLPARRDAREHAGDAGSRLAARQRRLVLRPRVAGRDRRRGRGRSDRRLRGRLRHAGPVHARRIGIVHLEAGEKLDVARQAAKRGLGQARVPPLCLGATPLRRQVGLRLLLVVHAGFERLRAVHGDRRRRPARRGIVKLRNAVARCRENGCARQYECRYRQRTFHGCPIPRSTPRPAGGRTGFTRRA